MIAIAARATNEAMRMRITFTIVFSMSENMVVSYEVALNDSRLGHMIITIIMWPPRRAALMLSGLELDFPAPSKFVEL